MSTAVYVPGDAAALSVGAEAVAAAIASEGSSRRADVSIVRNGSRGMFWLEPLVEVETPQGRVAYGPVTPESVTSLFDAGFLSGKPHPLCLGATEEIPFLKQQERLTFARCGITDPFSLSDYISHGGYRGLERALKLAPEAIVEEVVNSGLRGRGGAGFPTGIKWRTVLAANADQKYIVCNADEGDSGTYADRMIMEGDPFVLIEGMTIASLRRRSHQRLHLCAFRISARVSHAATRHRHRLQQRLSGRERRRQRQNVSISKCASARELTSAAKRLPCSKASKASRGQIRFKPPLPAISGLFGKPTVVNNVISLATVPIILDKGAEFYRNFGMGKSRGTLTIQLAGNVKHGGLVEKAFGLTLREAIYDFGGGTASGRPLRAVQVGGPLGAYFPESLLDTPLDYEAFAARKGMLGHGGIVVFDDTVDLARQARFAMEFCAVESCGKCTPCRIGSTRGVEVIDKIIANEDRMQKSRIARRSLRTDAGWFALRARRPDTVSCSERHSSFP